MAAVCPKSASSALLDSLKNPLCSAALWAIKHPERCSRRVFVTAHPVFFVRVPQNTWKRQRPHLVLLERPTTSHVDVRSTALNAHNRAPCILHLFSKLGNLRTAMWTKIYPPPPDPILSIKALTLCSPPTVSPQDCTPLSSIP